jgi:hypothetical protein
MLSCKGEGIQERINNTTNKIAEGISAGSATASPTYNNVAEEVPTPEAVKKLQSYIAKTKALLAAYEAELDIKKKQLEEERLDKLKLISYSCAGVCLIGVLVCVFLFFFSPIAKKMILTTGIACAATMGLALAIPQVLAYWLYFGYGLACISLCIGIYVLIKYRSSLSDSKAYYDLAKDVIESAVPKDKKEYVEYLYNKNEHREFQDADVKRIIDNTKADI